uniref:Uncharacterized protein n=1 Tax=Arundo donax TaxID=35708 RepID=A0A0A9F0N3_ARUDO
MCSSEVMRLLDRASHRGRGARLRCPLLRHRRRRRYIQGKCRNSVREDQHFAGGGGHGGYCDHRIT